MNLIFRKLKRLIFYYKQDSLWKYIAIKIFGGYKILSHVNGSLVLRTRFDHLIFEIPTTEEEYLFVANPLNELLLSSFMHINEGTFIDVGAFFGKHTIKIAKNQNVRVIAIEPNTISLNLLLKNIALNNVGNNVKVINAALVDSDKITNVTFGYKYGRSRILLSNDNDTFSEVNVVDAMSFNKLVKDYNINFNENVLMKIDVEGYEYNLLKSMKDFLLNTNSNFKIVCEILHNSIKKTETLNFLKSLSFNILQVDNENYYLHKK